MITAQYYCSTSQQLVRELVYEKNISIQQIAKKCHLSASTLYPLLNGSRISLRPQSFSRLFHFYLAATQQSLLAANRAH